MKTRTLLNQRGFVLTVALFVMVALSLLTGAMLLFAGVNLKTTAHWKSGVTTLQAADAAIHHALEEIGPGPVFSYTTKTTLLSSVPFQGDHTYTVEAINDPASPGGDTRAILTATALGPNGAKKVVVAYVKRGNFGLGTTSLPGSLAPNAETNFSGDTFTINGYDRCNMAPPVPAIMVTDPALATEITNETSSDGGLTVGQFDNVIGPGANNSVRATAPLEKSVLQYAEDYLNRNPLETLPGATYGGNEHWGTIGLPRITHVTGDVRIAGTIDGHGVLVLDGALHVSGDFTFNGLIILRGAGEIRATGNAKIYGAVLIAENTSQDSDYELDVRGTVNIQYDSCALKAAEGWNPLPKLPKIVAWSERMSN